MEIKEVTISFRIINPDFNQKYADEYHAGEESESNHKYSWHVSYTIENIVSYKTIKNEDYILKGAFKNGIAFGYKIPNVTICRCTDTNGNHTDFAVSNSILNTTQSPTNIKYETAGFYFYINYEPASVQIGKNLIVDENDVPEGLLIKE